MLLLMQYVENHNLSITLRNIEFNLKNKTILHDMANTH